MTDTAKLDPAVIDLIKKINEDAKVTHQEFSQLTAKINEVAAGRDKSASELIALRQSMEKAMADAANDQAAKLRVQEEYKASVPAAVFKDTIKEIQDKYLTMMKWVILAIFGSMLLFFGQDLAETIQIWLSGLLQ